MSEFPKYFRDEGHYYMFESENKASCLSLYESAISFSDSGLLLEEAEESAEDKDTTMAYSKPEEFWGAVATFKCIFEERERRCSPFAKKDGYEKVS